MIKHKPCPRCGVDVEVRVIPCSCSTTRHYHYDIVGGHVCMGHHPRRAALHGGKMIGLLRGIAHWLGARLWALSWCDDCGESMGMGRSFRPAFTVEPIRCAACHQIATGANTDAEYAAYCRRVRGKL